MDFKDFPLMKLGNGLGLIGCIYADADTSYAMVFPEYQGDSPPGEDVSMTKEDWEALIRQSDLIEAEVLAKAKDGKLYKAIIRKSARQISQQVSWNVFRRDGYACRYCDNDKVPLTVDHLVLWEEGGPSIEANLLTACKKCNKTRGNTQYAKWLRHSYYKRVSKALSSAQFQANEAVVSTLDKIERRYHKGSRR